MSLTSNSTDAEVRAAYENNASYDINGSVTEAADFIQACRFLLLRMPEKAGLSGGTGAFSEYKRELIRDMLSESRRWLQSNQTDTTARTSSGQFSAFRNFRG